MDIFSAAKSQLWSLSVHLQISKCHLLPVTSKCLYSLIQASKRVHGVCCLDNHLHGLLELTVGRVSQRKWKVVNKKTKFVMSKEKNWWD